MKKAALSQVKDDLSKYLWITETEKVIITRHGKLASVRIEEVEYRRRGTPCSPPLPRVVVGIAVRQEAGGVHGRRDGSSASRCAKRFDFAFAGWIGIE